MKVYTADECEICGDMYIVGKPHICRKENSYVPKLHLPRELAKECSLKNTINLINKQEKKIKELTEEKRNLEYVLEGVMHSVDKWLEGKELEQDEVNRAATMREKTLQIVEKLTEENEKIGIENFDLVCELSRIKEDTVRKMQERFSILLKKEYEENTPEGSSFYFKNGSFMMWGIANRVFDQIAKEMV